MAMINVNRGATSLGVFSEEDVRAGLRTGRFAPTDLGWREGMTSWQPLSQFPEFAEVTGAATAAGGGATVAPGSELLSATVARTGLPWENRAQLGLVKAFTDTLVMVLTKPVEAFQIMRTEGGLVDPLLYAIIGGSFGFIIYFLIALVLPASMGGGRNPLGMMFGAAMGTAFMIILCPVFIALGVFIGAGIIHLCLMLVGGAKRSFETTLRVVCFATGSTQPILVVPICGSFIAGIWGLVVECIGLARAHETDVGRAVLAILLPVIVCCGGGFLLMTLGIFAGMAGHH